MTSTIEAVICKAKRITYDYAEPIVGALRPVDGALAFLVACRDAGRRVGLATGADAERAAATLTELGLTSEDFDAVVTASEVARKKPGPDLFLRAAAGMDVPAGRCLVAEDAILGVQAAKAAESLCVALTTTFDAGALQAAGADWVAPTFRALPADLLARCCPAFGEGE